MDDVTVRRTRDEKIFFYSQRTIYDRKIDEFDNSEIRVAWLLFHYVHLRNCDKCLIHYYWSFVDGLKEIDSSTIHGLTPAETITRCRRHIQNDLGFFLPSEQDVIDARSISQDAVRDWVVRGKLLS
jgi:hypothetical protein